VRFAAVGGEFHLRRLRPYWLGRARPVSAGTRRGLPPSRRFWCATISGLLRGLAVRFSASSAGGATGRWRFVPSPDPRRHTCVAGPTVARRRCAIRAGRPDRAPLVRFASLQHIPATLRRPGRPASGRSRFGVGARISWRPLERTLRCWPREGPSPLRFYAWRRIRSFVQPRRPWTIVVEACPLRLDAARSGSCTA